MGLTSIKEHPLARPLVKKLWSLRQVRLWRRRERAFLDFLRRWPASEGKVSAGQEVWVIIQPWLGTPLPWYLLVLALGLSRRGRKVKVVWDDTALSPDVALQRQVQRSIGRIFSGLPASLDAVRLSEIPSWPDEPLSADAYQRLAYLNSIMRFHGETPSSARASYVLAAERSFRQTARRLQTLFQQSRPAYILEGGGIFSTSGLPVLLARQMGVRVATIDSGKELLLIATDGIAAWLDDIPRAFQMLPRIDELDDWIVSQARAVLDSRMGAADLALPRRSLNSYQLVPATGQIEPLDILLPLNQSYDTAALGRHQVFDSQMQWIMETVGWALRHTDAGVVIRRHPVEQYKELASIDDYEGALQERFGATPRVRYIAPAQLVNTYDLILQSRVVVPYVSTVGLEATALGKPVVTEGASYYAKLGFVWSAASRDEYFALLAQALDGRLVVTEPQRRDALRCYYLAQLCSFLHTSFTPNPYDFDHWVLSDPEELISSREVITILTAIDHNIPLSIINHNALKLKR